MTPIVNASGDARAMKQDKTRRTLAGKAYEKPELKEFGSIADLTAANNPVATKADGATMGNDKSVG
jgi:hypothetical protein